MLRRVYRCDLNSGRAGMRLRAGLCVTFSIRSQRILARETYNAMKTSVRMLALMAVGLLLIVCARAATS